MSIHTLQVYLREEKNSSLECVYNSYATGNGRFWDQWFKLEVEIKWKDRVGNDVITSCIVISLHQWSACLRSTLVPSDAFVRDRRRSSLPRVPSCVSPPENRCSHDWDPDPILVWCCEHTDWMFVTLLFESIILERALLRQTRVRKTQESQKAFE